MELYDDVAYATSKLLTLKYSTSFGLSTKLFPKKIQKHIYAIYGLVRIADEVVDSYKKSDALAILSDLEKETHDAIKRGYSVNPIVQAFARSAVKYEIDTSLITPFFDSMRMDITPKKYTNELYAQYIHGSAEVIGLMCLRVFCDGNTALYKALEPGASALGAAYQKVNFLRDLSSDSKELGRVYFPGYTYESFDEAAKQTIVADIERDFHNARAALIRLPRSCRLPVKVSYEYYSELLSRLKQTPVEVIKTTRVRVSDTQKVWLMAVTAVKHGVTR